MLKALTWGTWLIIAAFAMAGCGTYQGAEQFEAYRAAFEKAYGASTSILDQLAVSEREIARRNLRMTADRRTRDFNPDLASYYTDVGDPPGTAAVRRAVDTVKAYNDLLHGLVSGETAEALAAKLDTLGTKIADVSTELGTLSSGGAAAETKAFAAALRQGFAQIVPLVGIALKYRARDEFRQYVVQYYPDVRAILIELRKSTTKIFPVLTTATTRRARVNGGDLTAAEIDKLNNYRALLGDWVILIDTTIKSLDRVKLAVEAQPTISDAIGGLTQATIELEAASQSARKHLAEIAAK